MSELKKYDLIVIGTGGGTKLCTPAKKLGKKVAVIERAKLGGTCLNRGCIPSKMLIYPAHISTLAQEAKKLGVTATAKADFAKIVRRISRKVDGESAAIARGYQKLYGKDWYRGTARFVADKIIEVNGIRLTAPKIVIAVGARPRIPDIPGLVGTPYMTSAEALRNTVLPKKLVVIGGGYIASELGYAYSALGSDVSFVVRSCLIPHEDADVQQEFQKTFTKMQNVHLRWEPTSIEYRNNKFTITIKQGRKTKKITSDALLIATGVEPSTNLLDLKKTRIKTDKYGFIKVNKRLETSVPGIYAIGDCVGNYMFRHSVNFEGDYLFNQLFMRKKGPIAYPPMPHAIFTHPEIAAVGMTEQALIGKGKRKGKDYIVGINPYASSAMGMARMSDHGFVKLIFDKKTTRLLGAHIIGDDAATMIHQLIFAMTNKAKLADIRDMIYIHPALPEIVRNAARKAGQN